MGFRLLLVSVAMLATAACNTSPGERRPNVLFIVVDTLRADHLGCYGWARDTSPTIDRLAADAVRFERAYAASSWTVPSVASMFTGLYPSSHGATQTDSKLPGELRTLAEILNQHGYLTGGVITSTLLTARYNFNQGFDHYVLALRGPPHAVVSTDDVTREAQQLLRRFADREEPFFLFVHYFDPHYDYLRHLEFEFAAPSGGRLDGSEDVEGLLEVLDSLGPEEFGFLADLYDGEIRYTDRGIRDLLATLEELGLYDETLLLLTADHGEEFGEHDGLIHARTLYEEVLRVPLIIRTPGGTSGPRVVEAPVSLVSLTPTVLDLVGIEAPETEYHAPSLAAHLSSPAAGAVSIFAEIDYDGFGVYKKALITDRFKLIRDDTTGAIELYDLEADPDESEDLSQRAPDIVADLLSALERQLALARSDAVPAEQTPLSEEELEQLRSLGYIR